ncbi:unnamed protein product [Allacma fusca]|uniref:Uncharacterized protein n=1 Tax=Allacma fusca TaxID=39272 RepID=A0A8J2JM48_9HEXA|nr:unnamed protein product [Allacma fusca]
MTTPGSKAKNSLTNSSKKGFKLIGLLIKGKGRSTTRGKTDDPPTNHLSCLVILVRQLSFGHTCRHPGQSQHGLLSQLRP